MLLFSAVFDIVPPRGNAGLLGEVKLGLIYSVKITLIALTLISGCKALANGSAIREGIGGIEFFRNDIIDIQSETLEISNKLIKVNYIFQNTTNFATKTKIGFPFAPYYAASKCRQGSMEAADYQFQLRSQAQPLSYRIERQSLWRDRNITWLTDLLERFPTEAYLEAMTCTAPPAGAKLNFGWWEPVLRWTGIYDGYGPAWKIRELAVWEQSFDVGSTQIDIQYQPNAGWTLVNAVDRQNPRVLQRPYADRDLPTRRDSVCLDEKAWQLISKKYLNAIVASEEALKIKEANGGNGRVSSPWLHVRDIEYISGTGNNWKTPVHKFVLRLTKEQPDDIISVCFPGKPKRISNLTLEFQQVNFLLPQSIIVYFFELRHE